MMNFADESENEEQSGEGRGLVYGVHPVSELLAARPRDIDRIYFVQGKTTGPLFSLLKQCRKLRITYQVVPEMRLERLAPGARHQGVVAQCAAKEYASIEQVLEVVDSLSGPGLILVPASVEDPRNLGSIIRSAVAFGVNAILLERGNTSGLTDASAKTAAGMLEYALVCKPRSLEAAIGELKSRGFRVVGAESRAATPPDTADLRQSTVIVLGGEHRGIPPYLAKLCDSTVGIPLDERVESLNVSAAASVLLYECSRQRRAR